MTPLRRFPRVSFRFLIPALWVTVVALLGFSHAHAAPFVARCQLRGVFIPDGAFTDSAGLTVTLTATDMTGLSVTTSGRVYLDTDLSNGLPATGSWKTDGFLAEVPGLLSTTVWQNNDGSTNADDVPVVIDGAFDIPFEAPAGYSHLSLALNLSGRRVHQHFSNFNPPASAASGDLGLKVISVIPTGPAGSTTHELIPTRTLVTTFTTDGSYQPRASNLLSTATEIASIVPLGGTPTTTTGYSAARYGNGTIIRLEAYTYDDFTLFQRSTTNFSSTSNEANFFVTDLSPNFVTPPAAASVRLGSPHTFTMVATGTDLTYRWFKGGTLITGEVSSSYTIPSVLPADEASYRVEISNSFGTRLSPPAALTTFTGPVNDHFADAILLPGLAGNITATNHLASRELGEPMGGATYDRSVWWEWTAPATGTVSWTTAGSAFDTTLQFYQGSSLETLVRLAFDDDGGPDRSSAISLPVTLGTTYQIRVDGYRNASGAIALGWNLVLPPVEISFETYISDAPEGQRGPHDDPDHDGISNLVEYALNLDFSTSDVQNLPRLNTGDGFLQLSYFKARNSVTYLVQTTSNLNDPLSWTAGGVDQGGAVANGSMVTASTPAVASKQFLRLMITQP